MNITIFDKYHVTSDAFQYIITEMKGKRKNVKTYHTSLVGVLSAIQEREIMNSRARNLDQLLTEVKDIHNSLLQIKEGLKI
jgi:hypothetical protein